MKTKPLKRKEKMMGALDSGMQSGKTTPVHSGADALHSLRMEGSPSVSKPRLQSSGDLLIQARKAKGIPLAEIAQTLRISERYLIALEQNDYNNLPEPVYALGFLRSYARYLGMNVEKLIALHKASESTNETKPLTLPAPVPQNSIPTKSLAIATAVLACMIYGLWIILHSPVSQDIIADSFQELLNIQRSQKEQPIAEKEETLDAPLASEVISETPSAKPAPVKRALKHSAPSSKIAFRDLNLTAGETVKIQAHSHSWVELRDQRGHILLNQNLKAGESVDFSAEPGLLLSTGNAGGIALVTEAYTTFPLGAEGEVLKELELPFAD